MGRATASTRAKPGARTGRRSLAPRISPRERERIAKRNRALLDRDLSEKRLEFESGPYEAHVQFSNFCNMSCIMCWDGENPPLQRMGPEVLRKVRDQVAPTLSVVTPHSASEPLLATWDETLALARDFSVQLALTTNTQFLDAVRLEQAADHLEMLVMSIDSHLPEVFEKIRPGAKSAAVFENLPRAAAVCEERGIECMVQVVFMTENAASMPETVAYMADAGARTVNVIQMIDTNGRSGHLDATLHFSSEYLRAVRERCVGVARSKGIRLGWDLDGPRWFDFRDPARKVRPRRSKAWNDRFDQHMHLRHPGFCKYAYDRLQIELDGEVEPCGLATEGELVLGNLAAQDFDEIWNGPSAQDLRRAHHTWDYPSICATCRYADKPGPRASLPFAEAQENYLSLETGLDVEHALEVESPEHMARLDDAPVFRFRRPGRPVKRYVLLLALGGAADRVERVRFERAERRGDRFELTLPPDVWERLDTNVGWWWALFAVSGDTAEPHLRSREVRCLVRHEALPRVEGSALRYPDQGHLSPTYLGGERQVGWRERGVAPPRPELRQKGEPMQRRHVKRAEEEAAAPSGSTSAEEYARIVADLHAAVRGSVPARSRVLVVSRGDDALKRVKGRRTWHFPCDERGRWLGHHPPGDEWAVVHLEQLRARGADFLAFPATAFWWLEHYRTFADHLDNHYAVVAEHQRRYVIFDLREPAVPPSSNGRANGVVSREEALARLAPAPAAGDRPRSLMREADEVLGYGGHHRTALRPIYEGAADAFPRFAVAAAGCELTDSAGRTFVDWVGGGGPVLLGYRHTAVEEAIRAQLEAGPTLTLMHPLEVEVATLLREMVPCADMVTFGKNGSDALAAAIRVARAATGREVILQHGVHGFHEWFTCMHPGVMGVPKVLRALVQPFPYNDLEALAELFDRHPGEVAAIVMEPMAFELPAPGYLEGLVELAHSRGALVVFDEMVTGLRLANGGAQELFGVTPDLACFGKALANGMPLSALVGRRAYMELLPRVAYGMTFRGETLSLAAARAVLHTLREKPAAPHVAKVGAELRAGFERICAETGVRARLDGHPSRMTFAFHNDAGIEAEQAQALFLEHCAREGVLTNGNLMPTLAHGDEALARTLGAFERALSAVTEVVREGKRAIGGAMRGGFAADGIGFLDSVRAEPGHLFACGWMLLDDGPPDVVEAIGRDGARAVAERERRPDLADAHPAIPDAGTGGFRLTLPARDFASDGDYAFTLRGLRGDREVFACRAVRARAGHRAADHHPTRGADGVLRL